MSVAINTIWRCRPGLPGAGLLQLERQREREIAAAVRMNEIIDAVKSKLDQP